MLQGIISLYPCYRADLIYPCYRADLIYPCYRDIFISYYRADHVKDLVYPLNTVLDDSIGCAIWFASRGQGVIINQSGDMIPYSSPARVSFVLLYAKSRHA